MRYNYGKACRIWTQLEVELHTEGSYDWPENRSVSMQFKEVLQKPLRSDPHESVSSSAVPTVRGAEALGGLVASVRRVALQYNTI